MQTQPKPLSIEEFKQAVTEDYKLACISRQASLLGRKEVLTGKAKFGIFGDGKELAQIAMAKVFEDGDFRSGYYRDQTFMMAIGALTVRQFFAQLYADTIPGRDVASSGRQMNGHFSTSTIDENGEWMPLSQSKNSSADISPTAGQMLRLLGLGYASKIFRNVPGLESGYEHLSNKGNEVAFGTIGNASSAEGHFWETVNAGGVLMGPMAISIWDDGYGISVSNEHQITKQDLSELLSGFAYDQEKGQGYQLFTARGWNYAELVATYMEGIKLVREKHIPAIFHITELTQPQGHSTSGSHERYKSKERLEWEQEYDCMAQMRKWMEEQGICTAAELDAIEKEAKDYVKAEQKQASEDAVAPIKEERKVILGFLQRAKEEDEEAGAELNESISRLVSPLDLDRKTNYNELWTAIRFCQKHGYEALKAEILAWKMDQDADNADRYNSLLHTGTALEVEPVAAEYGDDAVKVDGREILVSFFDSVLERDPRVFAFGEDVGKIGDVNQGMAGLQEKHGVLRVSDTGIREATIMGQGIGAAIRGLRPIAEIQYLDYLLYGLQILSDDASTMAYRTKGKQRAPIIVRTRGHRLEGVWHSGSPMGVVVNALRGMYVCVPRNMVQAAGMYNTLLQGDEPALVIERLNAYRMKELKPSNIGEYTVELGKIEVLREGSDITLVTYGACTDIALDGAELLAEFGISLEVIDVQTLLPFDLSDEISQSIAKTNKVIFMDEDVPGGGSAYMMQQVLEVQGAYPYLDAAPRTLSAHAHRPAYGTDGDYFSKPNKNDVFALAYCMMHEYDPQIFPEI